MKRHPFGSTKHQVSVIGQGTWYIETADRRSAIAALRRGLDLGMIHIDTAEMYGSGVAEEVVAEAIMTDAIRSSSCPRYFPSMPRETAR